MKVLVIEFSENNGNRNGHLLNKNNNQQILWWGETSNKQDNIWYSETFIFHNDDF